MIESKYKVLGLIMVGCVEKTNEEKMTKFLSSKEILGKKKLSGMLSVPKFDLGRFLEKQNSKPSRFGIRYKFVK